MEVKIGAKLKKTMHKVKTRFNRIANIQQGNTKDEGKSTIQKKVYVSKHDFLFRY